MNSKDYSIVNLITLTIIGTKHGRRNFKDTNPVMSSSLVTEHVQLQDVSTYVSIPQGPELNLNVSAEKVPCSS